MSVEDFIRDPVGYSKSHVIQFSHHSAAVSPAASGMQVVQTFDNWGGGWKAEEYDRIPGQFTSFRFEGDTNSLTNAHVRIGKGSTNVHSIRCETVPHDRGIRFLPWKPNYVTFMQLDAAATTFYTGPLSGCSIFIGRTAAGAYWAFHANRNNIAGAANEAMKTNMLINTVGCLAAPVPIIHQCIYGRHYHDLGFVFGQRKGNRWRFYVADTRALAKGGHYATRVTELP